MTTKATLHRLVDELPDDELAAAERVLATLRDRAGDPVRLAVLTAPLDDEGETREERAGASAARAQIARGDVVGNEELRREIGW